MGGFVGLIYVVVFLFIIFKVLKAAGKNGTSAFSGNPEQKSPAYKAAMESIQSRSAMVNQAAGTNTANAGVVRSDDFRPTTMQKSFASTAKEPSVNRLMDDREHDWLAGQLRDERIAKRKMSEMFDLKREHAASCDAEMLKRFHADNCDAEDIDTARA